MRFVCRLFLLLLALAVVVAAGRAVAAAPYSGRPLHVVIDELRAAGAPLVYSSNLLPSSLVVTAEPASTEPLAIARELLAPHGLAVRESAGVWLVVRGEPAAPPPARAGAVNVSVISSATGEPISDAIVQADAPGGPSVALIAGRGQLRDLAAGRHVLTVRAAGYLFDRAAFNVAAGATAAVEVALVEAAPKLDEFTVTASRYDVMTDAQPSTSYFSRDDIETLSELGDDALRVAHRMPGVAAGDFSARSHVRGGAADEMTVILDGMRLIEPYHLRDYQAIFSAVDQRIVSGLQIYSGGFPAAYGDALSGLTVIDQREPTELHHELGLSVLFTSALSSGVFRDGRGQWLVSARRGNLDSLLNDNLGEPAYRDAFVHVGIDLGDKHRLVLNDIGFDDDVRLTPDSSPGHREVAESNTDSNQLWLKLESNWSDELSSRTLLSSTRLTAERRGNIDDIDQLLGSVNDRRELDASGFKQDWSWTLSERQLWTFGAEAEQLDSGYRYSSVAELRGILATLGNGAPATRDYALAPDGESYSVYATDRVRITDRFIAELGVRWDRQTYLPVDADEQFSPRSSLLYRLGARTDLRLSYGRFFQAEGLLDLQVEDGVLDFAPAQNASHTIVGMEHRFDGDLTLRVEAFRKWTQHARPRYENLFDPLELLPELRAGRVRVAPDRAEARGLEVLVNNETPLAWWFGYSYARVYDIIAQQRVARSWDQRHAINGGLSFDVGPWSMNLAGSIHSGWPATVLSLQTLPDGSSTVVAGERNSGRLGWHRRLDLRTSRTFRPSVGSLRFFAELTNATNKRNPCCLGYDSGSAADGSPTLTRVERSSLPLMTNIGVLWEF